MGAPRRHAGPIYASQDSLTSVPAPCRLSAASASLAAFLAADGGSLPAGVRSMPTALDGSDSLTSSFDHSVFPPPLRMAVP